MKWDRALAGIVLAAIGAAALHAALRSLGPDSPHLVPYNSDSGMAVLQVNDAHWDFYRVFAYGQDRFGAWPFFLIHLFVRQCTPAILSAITVSFVFSGVIPAVLLARPAGAYGGLAWIAAILWPDTAIWIFSFSQPYAWQLVTLLWAFWALRRMTSQADFVLAAALCFLAVWASRLSGPMLIAVALLEEKRRFRVLPPLVGVIGEIALRGAYHRFTRAHFHRQFATDVSIDWGYLGLHVRAVAGRLFAWDVFVPLLVLVAAAIWLRRERTLAGALALALVPIAVLMTVVHVRENEFSDRYFTPTLVFLRWGALIGLGVLAGSRRVASALLAVAVGAAIWRARPRGEPLTEPGRMQATARGLAERARGAVLIDGYWGAYVIASLAPPGALRPLAKDGDYDRMPFVEDELPRATRVVVGHRDFMRAAKRGEAPSLYQYSVMLEPVEPDFFSSADDWFSLYRPHPVATAAVETTPLVAELDLAVRARELEVRLPRGAAAGGALVIVHTCDALPALPSADGAAVTQLPDTVVVVPAPGTPSVRIRFPPAPCRLKNARWLSDWRPEWGR